MFVHPSYLSVALEGASEALWHELDPAWNIKVAITSFSLNCVAQMDYAFYQVTIIEPGNFRTEAWSSQKKDLYTHPAYEHNSELDGTKWTKYFRDTKPQDIQGDPNKLAEMLMKLVEWDEKPLRILCGSDAWMLSKQVITDDLKTRKEYFHNSDAWAKGLEFS